MPSAYMKSRMKSYMPECDILDALKLMVEDPSYHTKPGYNVDEETYPDNKIPFLEEHVNYLKKHPQVNPEHYLSNLRIMLKVR